MSVSAVDCSEIWKLGWNVHSGKDKEKCKKTLKKTVEDEKQ